MQFNEIYMSIELSDYSIKAVVGEYFNMKLNVLAAIEKEITFEVKDVEASSEQLKKVVFEIKDELTALIGYEIKNTILVLPSTSCKKFSDKVRVETSTVDHVAVTEDKAKGIKEIVKKNDVPPNFVVNVVINKMSAFGYGYVSQIEGLSTRYIELECSVYTIPQSVAFPILKVIEECGIAVVDVCLDILAIASEAILPSALKSGAVLVDMGASSTNIAYFKDNTLKSFHTINQGGKNITNDISLVTKIDVNKAESFKKKFVDLDVDHLEDLSIYKYFDEVENKEVDITQKFISQIALARQEEILSLINDQLEALDLGVEDIVYFSGGANKINNLDHLLKYKLHYPYQILTSKTLGARSSSFIKCIGAILYQATFSRSKGELKLFVNKKDYSNALNLVENNNLLYNNHKGEQAFIKRLVSYIFTN